MRILKNFLLLAAVFFCVSGFAHGQGLRWDLGAPGSAGAVTASGSTLLVQPGVSLAWCNFPANAVPCNNYAPTYTDQTLAFSCPSSAPIVLQGSTTCQSTSDNYGNMGVFVAVNGTCGGNITCYAYTLTVNGQSSGPYIWTQAATNVTANFASPPPIGVTAPNTGAFTTLAATGPFTVGPSTPAGISALEFNGPDPYCMSNAHGFDQLSDCTDPATGSSSLAWNPTNTVNEFLQVRAPQSSPFMDGNFWAYNSVQGLPTVVPNVSFNSQTGNFSMAGCPAGSLLRADGLGCTLMLGAPPLAVTVEGATSTYTGTDLCSALSSAILANPNAVVINARGYLPATGYSVCTSAHETALDNALTAMNSASADISLGCPLTMYLPLQSFGAATSTTPRIGSLTLTPFARIHGCGPASVAGNLTTQIAACTGTNLPVTGCTAPATHDFTISSTSTSTVATSSPSAHRAYMAINSSGMDLVGGEPVHINGGGVGTNNLAIIGAYRVCQVSGSTPVYTDPFCPANPTSTTVYVPIPSGIGSTTITSGGTGGSYDSNTVVSFSGGSCFEEPTGSVTVSGGVITAFYIATPGLGCTSAPSVAVSDPTGSGSGASLSVALASANMTCASTCGSILHAELPLIELVDFNGTNGTATMGSTLQDVIVDCRELEDCVGYRTLGANEHTNLSRVNFAGQVERAFDVHTKNTNGMDSIDSVRVLPGKLTNVTVPFTASGSCTVTGGTTCTATTGTGFSYGNNGSSLVCNYATGTPVLIDGAYNSTAGCSATNITVTFTNSSAVISGTNSLYAGAPVQFTTTGSLPTNFATNTTYYVSSSGLSTSQFEVSANIGGAVITAGSAGSGTQTTLFANILTLASSVSNASHTYFIAGCDAGVEAGYIGDGGPHGIKDFTGDFSGCITSNATPYNAAASSLLQVPNCGLRVDTNYWSNYILGGHVEKVWLGLCAGLDAPARGLHVDSWYGAPNAYDNTVGPFQNRQSVATEIFPDYFTTSTSSAGTTHYHFSNIGSSFNSYYTLVDGNPVGVGLTPGPADFSFNTEEYSVEWSILAPYNSLCVTALSTTYWGNNFGCPLNGFIHSTGATKSLTADTSPTTGTSLGTGLTVFTFSGFTANTTYSIHCSGTTVQATAGAGIGIGFQTTGTATPTEIHATVATSATASAYASSGLGNTTSGVTIYGGSTGTPTTQLPWSLDGSMVVGGTAPTALNIGFYTINASDAVTVKENSYCQVF